MSLSSRSLCRSLLALPSGLRSALWCQPFSTSTCRRSAAGNPTGSVIIDGQRYPSDSWTNVPPSIISQYGRKLHVQPSHPLSITRKLIESCFPGFHHHNNLDGVVTTDQNFDSLGFASDHPGRSRTDTYYINKDTLLRTHTSAHEVDVFRANTSNGYTISADVYRRDAIDRTHYPIFHQIEGALTWERNDFANNDELVTRIKSDFDALKVPSIVAEDPNPTFHPERNPLQTKHHSPAEAEAIAAHLKRSLENLVVAIFAEADRALETFGQSDADTQEPLKVRWVEAFFPHTSPSWELEVWWRNEWLEVLGCGVVDQPLLIRADVPSRVGWAFGLGLERLAILLFGIPDIRLFWSKDQRFLDQFDEAKPIRRFQPFSKYPAAPRDVAFWLPDSGSVVAETPASTSSAPSPSGGQNTEPAVTGTLAFHENDLMEVVRNTAGDSVEDVSLVDDFKHPKTGRRSLCYRVIYRSLEKTLTNEEANAMHEQIRQELNIESTFVKDLPRMRPVTRQGARLTKHCRSKQQSTPRYPPTAQQRPLHSTTTRQQDSRAPNENHDRHQRSSAWREPQQKTSEDNVTGEEDVANQEDGDVKSGGEMRKHTMRRTLRQKRSNDVPKPPPIPDWFLDNNITLWKDSETFPVDKQSGDIIRCVDDETGHTLFTVPYYNAWPKVDSQEVQARKVDTKRQGEGQQSQADVSNFDQNFFDQKFQASPSTRAQQSKNEDDPVPGADVSDEVDRRHHGGKGDPMHFICLEIEASIRAALDLVDDPQRSASITAGRVDLSLQCPDRDAHDQLDELVQDLANVVQADVLRIDANDFAELTADYVGHGNDEPGSFSTLGYDTFDGYATTALGNRSHSLRVPTDSADENEVHEEEEDEESEHDDDDGDSNSAGPFTSIAELRRAMQNGSSELGKMLGGRVIGIGFGTSPGRRRRPSRNSRWLDVTSDSTNDNRDDARLAALLDQILDAPRQKRATLSSVSSSVASKRQAEPAEESTINSAQEVDPLRTGAWLRHWRSIPAFRLPQVAEYVYAFVRTAAKAASPEKPRLQSKRESGVPVSSAASTDTSPQRTVVHVRDLRDITQTHLGDTIVQRLVKAVQKRRRTGEQVIVVGTTAQDVPGPLRMPGDSADDFPFRAVDVPAIATYSSVEHNGLRKTIGKISLKRLGVPASRRTLEINLRHLQSMLRRMRPNDSFALLSSEARAQFDIPGTHFLSERILVFDEVQRLALTAIGLSRSYALSDTVNPIHVSLAAHVTSAADHIFNSWREYRGQAARDEIRAGYLEFNKAEANKPESRGERIQRLKKICNQHETRLLSGMVDPENIKTGFTDVHAPPDTIEALKTLTTLSLLRPDAFKYGVLANDRLPGLLLYGPPGTGKTLLAKAVAKEAKSTVLEVSGAQIYEKYVGEGEKMVRAVFSLAKKLSPCIVFIDEADAIFASRGRDSSRNTHREIINQFLREWDGMEDNGVFMMVASNRPFDLDDAVLRRLPRRLLVDLPVAKDREAILGIHLRNETLDPDVSLANLSEQTTLYSGSDLKNLAVAAALACVREENDLAETHRDDKDFALPEKRLLTPAHFDKALAEISASISEDMSSLTAIKKFDEQYGDRRGRRKKPAYGFGMGDGGVDEGAALVRQPPASPPSPPS